MTHPEALKYSDHVAEYTWRPARREDALAMHELLVDIESVDQRGWVDTLEERERDFNDPATCAETDTLLGFANDGKLAAIGWLISLPPSDKEHLTFLWGEVHPEHRQRGLGSYVLKWMETRSREILATRRDNLPRYLRANTPENLTDRISLYEQHGFELVRSFYRMRRDLSLPIPEVRMPPGITLCTYSPELDQATMQANDEAFMDHWGYAPIDQEAWRLFFIDTPDFRPELTYLAMSEDGQVAGICFNEVRQEENIALGIQQGWIRSLAVRRPWRNQGLGTALMCASMHAFRQAGMDYAGLGVDSENLTGALHLYEQLGFNVVRRFLSYSKTV
jgi:mycothiol synthase